MTKAKILIAEDEKTQRDLLEGFLKKEGFFVDAVANGREAVQKLKENFFDIGVIDYKMPELDGPGFYLRLTQEHPELRGRFGFVTGDTVSHETKAFLESMGAPSLNKPFTLEEVRRMAQRLLRSP